jgi:hypothetical protein
MICIRTDLADQCRPRRNTSPSCVRPPVHGKGVQPAVYIIGMQDSKSSFGSGRWLPRKKHRMR